MKQYLLSVLFLMIAFQRPLESLIGKSKNRDTIYFAILVTLFSVLYYLSSRADKDDIKEDFFFTVSKCNPKCSGAYYGKPATFQFTEIKQAGVPCEGPDCPSYGMIRGCSTARTYGGGYAPYTYKCREAIC